MNENNLKDEHRDKHGSRLDSFSVGSSAKGGVIKIYFDLSSLKDEDVVGLCVRAKNLYKKMCEGI